MEEQPTIEQSSLAEWIAYYKRQWSEQRKMLREKLASSAQTLADSNRASDYALDVMRRVLGRRDVHGIEEGADAVAKLVDGLRGELAAAKALKSTLSGTVNGAMQVVQDWHDRAEAAEARYATLTRLCVATEEREREAITHAMELRAALETYADVNQWGLTHENAKHCDWFLSVGLPADKRDGWAVAVAALARTPDQSLAAVQARVLREVANLIRQSAGLNAAYHAALVDGEAERLEKEAGDAKPKD